MFNNIKNFLTNSTVTIPGPDGTPSKSNLLNVTMKNFPITLLNVPNLHSAIYAVDITQRCTKGSKKMHCKWVDIVQVQPYTNYIGLICSPQKTEYSVVPNQPNKKQVDSLRKQITLSMNSTPIPCRTPQGTGIYNEIHRLRAWSFRYHPLNLNSSTPSLSYTHACEEMLKRPHPAR